MAGRPKKYRSRRALEEAVERYFASISRTVEAKDDTGGVIRNDVGEPIRVRQYITPPSVSGLCLHLGIDRSTWQNYADPESNPELAAVAARTRARMEAWLEEQLVTREKSVQGIIFNLQNNFGWRDKREVELGDRTRETLRDEALSLSEKLEVIEQAREHLQRLQGGDAGAAGGGDTV